MRVGEHTVRISGFRRQPLGAIEIRGLNGTSIVSLVVSPSADPDQAYDTLMAAATPDDAPTTERLLRAGSA